MNNKKKFCFLIDTSSDQDAINIHSDTFVIPFGIIINDGKEEKVYDDWYQIDRDSVIEALDKGYDVKTSQPSYGKCYNEVENLLKEFEKVIIFTITKEFSGTYQSYLNIKKALETKYGKDRILVVDSKSLGYMQNECMKLVKKLMDSNKTFGDIEKTVKKYINSYCGFTCITNATQLVKGGRLKGLKAILVKALNLKLIIKYRDGKLDYQDKATKLAGAIDKGFSILEKELNTKKNKINKVCIFIDLPPSNELNDIINYTKLKFNMFENVEFITDRKLPTAIIAHLGGQSFTVVAYTDFEGE